MENTMEMRLAALEKRVRILEDREEIANLIAKHNYYFSAGQGRRIVPELWTKEEETASIEYGASGVYRKLWKVKSFYVNHEVPGRLSTLMSANRFLRFSADGNAAHGVWMLLGTETDAGDFSAAPPAESDQRRVLFSSRSEDGKAYRAEVLLQKLEAELIREDGAWKIAALHISEYFRFPAGSDWVRFAKERQVTDGMWLESLFETPDPLPWFENLPSGPSTSHWQYDTEAEPVLDLDLDEDR